MDRRGGQNSEPGLDYSHRNATTGSTAIARLAGSTHASIATTPNTTVTATSVNGSAADEHMIGLKKKIYLRWARATIDPAEREHIAAMELAIKFDDALYSNIPILVTSGRLASLAGQNEIAEEYILRLEQLNPSIAALVRNDDNEIGYWEDESIND